MLTTNLTANASFDTEVYLTVEKLSSSTSVNGITIPAGYYKVDVKTINNPGVATVALGFALTNLTPKLNSGNPVIKNNLIAPGIISYNSTSKRLAVLYSGTENMDDDGTLFTFYVSKSTGTASITTTIGSFADSSGAPLITSDLTFSGSINSTTLYKVGDSNGNGSVTAEDATTILTALQNHYMPNASIAVKAIQNNLNSWFPNARCADAVDADQDGYISSADSNAILNYYAYVLMGETYNGTVGTQRYYIS
jgi:hypothetical protein